MCEKCNCKTSENIHQEALEGCVVKLSKKDYIEDSLNTLFDSLESLDFLDYKISNSSEECEVVNCERPKFIFESLEALLNNLPDKLYKTSERIYKKIDNINAKLF